MKSLSNIPQPNDDNTLIFGKENPHYTFMFTHEKITELDRAAKSYFEEAVDRFASLLVENLNKMDIYQELENDHLDGIKTTIKTLKKANDNEDRLSDSFRDHKEEKEKNEVEKAMDNIE